MSKGFWITAGIILLLVTVLVLITGRKPNPKEVREYKEGTPDTVFVKGDPDTVFFSRVYEKIVQVPVEKIVSFGRDSSKTDTTVNLENGTLTLGLTTYPAIESLKLDIDLLTVDREIVRVDTFKVTRVDTLNITKEVSIEPAWYETWWFGSLLTTAVGITAIILGK
ncbi:MAG: hypothetical protein J0L60_06565 [Ignavibacteria bacterium]|nr:hypothetical protein [Ignavibacteria bacterium]